MTFHAVFEHVKYSAEKALEHNIDNVIVKPEYGYYSNYLLQKVLKECKLRKRVYQLVWEKKALYEKCISIVEYTLLQKI